VIHLPHLPPTAKAQLWGLLVGGSLAVLVVYRAEFSWIVFLIGWAIAWAVGETLFGRRLIGASDAKAIALAVVSGIAFPWIGVALAALSYVTR